MGLKLERPVEVGKADKIAEIVPPGLVLREQRQVIDPLAVFPHDAQQGPDDRLHAVFGAGGGKGDCAARARYGRRSRLPGSPVLSPAAQSPSGSIAPSSIE